MPDQFDGFPIALFSRHFLVTYASEGDTDALARAMAIASSCEDDLSILEKWFNCNFDSSPYTIWVHVGPGTLDGGASNYGYEGDDESSRIYVGGTYQPASPDPNSNAIRDDLARMLFVAELAEILMDFTGYGWDRGDSSGEGLSRVAATELHPLGYYGAEKGPIVSTWIQSDRHNYVDGPEGTDTNALSYGCAILFLNYLRYQRGFSFAEIVQAGGSSLAETYARLTKEPAANAFASFQALLTAHIPFAKQFTALKDNIFPLLDQPGLGFLVDQQLFPSTREAGPAHHIELQVGPICPARDYTYAIDDIPFQMTVQAVTRGFVSARFEWTLGETTLPVHGLMEEATINVRITDTTPGKDPITTIAAPVRYIILDSYNTSTLKFWNKTFPGNGDVDITAVAHDGEATTFKASRTENWPYQTRKFVMDPPYAADVKVCNPRFVDLSVLIQKLGERLFILKTLPDPTPEQLIALAGDLDHYRTLLKELSGGSKGMQEAVINEAGSLRDAVVGERGVQAAGVAGGRPTRSLRLPWVDLPGKAKSGWESGQSTRPSRDG